MLINRKPFWEVETMRDQAKQEFLETKQTDYKVEIVSLVILCAGIFIMSFHFFDALGSVISK